MHMWIWLYIGIGCFISVLLWAIFTVVKYSKKRKLSPEKITLFSKQLRVIGRSQSSKEIIIDSDTLYHKILNSLGYKWSFWEILRAEPNEVLDLQKIWKLHKIRNALVHDFDNHDEVWLKKQSRSYQKQVQYLIKNVS